MLVNLYSARLTLREEVTRLFYFSSIARAGPSLEETGACYADKHKMVDFIISLLDDAANKLCNVLGLSIQFLTKAAKKWRISVVHDFLIIVPYIRLFRYDAC